MEENRAVMFSCVESAAALWKIRKTAYNSEQTVRMERRLSAFFVILQWNAGQSCCLITAYIIIFIDDFVDLIAYNAGIINKIE